VSITVIRLLRAKRTADSSGRLTVTLSDRLSLKTRAMPVGLINANMVICVTNAEIHRGPVMTMARSHAQERGVKDLSMSEMG
jgi:hypothetical protein